MPFRRWAIDGGILDNSPIGVVLDTVTGFRPSARCSAPSSSSFPTPTTRKAAEHRPDFAGVLNTTLNMPRDVAFTDHLEEMTYRPKPGFRGVDAFGITVSDGSGAQTTATVTVRVTRDGTGPVVRLAAGPLKVRAGTARATIGCEARTAGGCTGVAILRLGGPRGPVVARTKVHVNAGRAHVIDVPLRARDARARRRATGARRC